MAGLADARADRDGPFGARRRAPVSIDRARRSLSIDDHRQCRSNLFDTPDFLTNGILEILHNIGLEASDDVINTIDQVSFLDLRYRFELLEYLALRSNLSINQHESSSQGYKPQGIRYFFGLLTFVFVLF